MKEFKNRFILLRKIRFSEADLVIHGLSMKGGKHSFIAKGALKSKKRFGGGVLEPGHYVELTYQQKQTGAMSVLTEARILADFPKIKNSFEQVEFMLKILELIGKIAQEGDENSEFLFNLVGHCLRAIENSSPGFLPTVKMAFFIKLLYQQGVLELESWMKPFLQTELKSITEVPAISGDLIDKLDGLENIIDHYAATAGV